MIITRYLVREIFKRQFAILFILLLIFFCQKLIRILNAVVDGDIPINLVLFLLTLGVPEMAQLILPMSLYLGLLMTLRYMYSKSEIIVMHACGLGKNILIRAALLLSFMTSILAAINVTWISPWSALQQDLILSDVKANPSVTSLAEGDFKLLDNGNIVLFIGNVHSNNKNSSNLKNVFLAYMKSKSNMHPSIVIADHGNIYQLRDGTKLIILYNGIRYEGILRNFYITDFTQYQAIIDHRASIGKIALEQIPLPQLWRSLEKEKCTELYWRLTLIASIFIMAIMVIPLSEINPRCGCNMNILTSILLYIFFFLLQTTLHSNGVKGNFDPRFWIWLTNILYFIIALALNFQDSILIKKFRTFLHNRNTREYKHNV